MKVFRHSILLLFALLCGLQGQAQQQRFFNLTVDDIAIDTMLPRFSYAIPLGKHYADSIYTLEIRYPEFLDMGRRDSLRYLALAPSADPGRLPEIEQHIVVDRKKGRLDFSLCPVVRRKGRLQFLVSFMIAVTSQPKPALKAPSRAGSQGDSTSQEDAAIYAKHSVLREGRWVKIRVPESGIYQLTSQLARQAGFSDLSRVRIFGYGGTMVVMVRHGAYITVYANLRNVSVRQGQKVGTGQTLGTVGSDGVLQFQLRKETAKLNPESWLR